MARLVIRFESKAVCHEMSLGTVEGSLFALPGLWENNGGSPPRLSPYQTCTATGMNNKLE